MCSTVVLLLLPALLVYAWARLSQELRHRRHGTKLTETQGHEVAKLHWKTSRKIEGWSIQEIEPGPNLENSRNGSKLSNWFLTNQLEQLRVILPPSSVHTLMLPTTEGPCSRSWKHLVPWLCNWIKNNYSLSIFRQNCHPRRQTCQTLSGCKP